MDQNAKNKAIEQIKKAQSVLVTVSDDPSLDQLSAAIALGLWLQKQKKHSTTVFSGAVPSALRSLDLQKNIQQSTDSLRDFIISLDKNKADKLKYKIEDDVVKIFITPYKTSISESDLQFTQGELSADMVIGLGVTKRGSIDKAILAHGRILHDSVFLTINNQAVKNIGNIEWTDQEFSSISEMVADLIITVDRNHIDKQIANSLMTGIVSTTNRFRSEHTTARTLNIGSVLLESGANQQLVNDSIETMEKEEANNLVIEHNEGDIESQTLQDIENHEGEVKIDNKEQAVSDQVEQTETPQVGAAQPESQDSAKSSNDVVLNGEVSKVGKTLQPESAEANEQADASQQPTEPEQQSAPEQAPEQQEVPPAILEQSQDDKNVDSQNQATPQEPQSDAEPSHDSEIPDVPNQGASEDPPSQDYAATQESQKSQPSEVDIVQPEQQDEPAEQLDQEKADTKDKHYSRYLGGGNPAGGNASTEIYIDPLTGIPSTGPIASHDNAPKIEPERKYLKLDSDPLNQKDEQGQPVGNPIEGSQSNDQPPPGPPPIMPPVMPS